MGYWDARHAKRGRYAGPQPPSPEGIRKCALVNSESSFKPTHYRDEDSCKRLVNIGCEWKEGNCYFLDANYNDKMHGYLRTKDKGQRKSMRDRVGTAGGARLKRSKRKVRKNTKRKVRKNTKRIVRKNTKRNKSLKRRR